MNAPLSLIDARLVAIRPAALEMKLYELAAADGAALPAIEPGAHIDLHLPNGMTRQYSLVNHGAAPVRYVIGVKREDGGKGGSRWLHDHALEGMGLQLGGPRNHFGLDAKAPHSVLIAGGIGITPIYNMATRLQAEGRSWELHYGCRSRGHCAFHDELLALGGERVHFYFDDELGPGAIPLARLAATPDAHLYCCGPQGLLAAYEAACAGLPAGRVHLEHFGAPEVVAAPSGGFVVELARSGKTIEVPAGKTILDCVMALGIDVPYSCSQGVCGSCETRVLAGTPEHRDLVLTPDEQASNKTMMICCSGSRGPSLTLDL